MENTKEKLNNIMKVIAHYSFILITFIVGVSIGYYYNHIETTLKTNKVSTVSKKEIELAVDESNHLIIIDKKDWSYTIYQDSVGYAVFNLYAKNIWGQASNPKLKN